MAEEGAIGHNRRLPLDGEIPREPDNSLLYGGLYGPHVSPRTRRFEDLTAQLQETLVRMDDKETAKFSRFVSMISSMDMEEIERIYKLVKIFGFLRWLYGGTKWLILSFLAGVTFVATGGEKIEKIFGYIQPLIAWWKSQ